MLQGVAKLQSYPAPPTATSLLVIGLGYFFKRDTVQSAPESDADVVANLALSCHLSCLYNWLGRF